MSTERITAERLTSELRAVYRMATLSGDGFEDCMVALARRALELIPEGGPTKAEAELIELALWAEGTDRLAHGLAAFAVAAAAVRAERKPKGQRFVVNGIVVHDTAARSEENRVKSSPIGFSCHTDSQIEAITRALNAAHERGELP